MGNPFEDLRQAVVVRPMNSPGPQGAAGPEVKIQYSFNGSSWHDAYVEHDKYIRFSTDNGVTWSNAIYFNNLAETLEWVEKAKQWAENPENVPVEAGKYSALHHATRAARSEENAEAAALEAENLVSGAYGIAPPLWDRTTVYDYNDIVSFDNGQVYRCIGTNIVGETHAPNINGIDNEEDWTRVTAVLDGFFEVDENGDFMPMIAPVNSDIFMLDKNGDIMYQDPIDIEVSMATIELFTLDENGDIAYRDPTDHRPGGGNIELYKEIEFVDSIADFRSSSFYGTTKYVYVAGYYGAGTPGGGMFYKDVESTEPDNGGTIIIDAVGVRWKRANVHEEYYASWFGVSTDIDDNSPFIQNALNAVPLGGILIFGPGTYQCKQTIIYPYQENISFDNRNLSTRGITLQGSGKIPMFQHTTYTTILKYTGPNQPTLTPFFDFRGVGNKGIQYFCGSIRNIKFVGPGANSNIVGLWFHECIGSLLDSTSVWYFKYGIKIDAGYYYCKFNDVTFVSCDCCFRANKWANFAVFNYCNFKWSNIGYWHGNDDIGMSTGTNFYACYFEGMGISIKVSSSRILNINQCYFEYNKKYNIDISTKTDVPQTSVLQGSRIDVNFLDLISNKASIRQAINQNTTLTLSLKDNVITNYGNTIPDYFVYVESGNIIIQAENNKMVEPSFNFPICSKTPLKTSYFNNDFSDTD